MSFPTPNGLELDLHGVVGLRVLDARPEEARGVRAQTGAVARTLDAPPDLTVRFVDRLDHGGLAFVEPGRSGFTPDGYLVLSHRRRAVAVRMPFDAPAPPVEIVCEHGVAPVPMLEDWVRLVALARGHVPLHASAFEYGGRGVLVAGGPHGGKTSCLLAFAGTGARFLADDLVLLSGDGGTLSGVGRDISVSDWQLRQLPAPGRRLGVVRRAILAGARRLERLEPRLGSGALGSLTHAGPRALRRRAKVVLEPEALFGGTGPRAVPTGTVFLAESHASPEIRVDPVPPDRLAGRLAATLRLQLHPLFEHYLGYRFAFPERTSPWLEEAGTRAETLLRRALEGRETFVVRHPHPVSLAGLRHAMGEVLDAPPVGPLAAAAPGGAPALGSPRA